MTKPAEDRIVAFYRHEAADHRGRTLRDIWTWDHDRLEMVHDYIQWVFPTPVRSQANPRAPFVSDATTRAFDSAPMRARLRKSLDRMLSFYGLRWRDGHAIEIDPVRFPAQAETWLHAGNHNHLRLTRIMQSLYALGLRGEAEALQRCLLDLCEGPGRDRVTPETRRFWARALQKPSFL